VLARVQLLPLALFVVVSSFPARGGFDSELARSPSSTQLPRQRLLFLLRLSLLFLGQSEAAAGSFIAARLGFAELRAAAAILDVRAVVGARGTQRRQLRERFPGEARRHHVAERSAIADPFR
jgi:hypothetical protein